MTNRLTQAHPAVRPALKARLLVAGPSGAGKTWTSLAVATELAGDKPILGIDTESQEMVTYADNFTFTHLPWTPPYDPRELAATLTEASRLDNYGCIVVDSLTHFWSGTGGTLEIAGGKFTGWKDARPAQEDLIEAIKQCQCHIVLAARSKMEFLPEQDSSSGKHTVRKMGMAVKQDDTLEYEVNVAVDLTIDHTATISKSRTTALAVGREFRPGHVDELARIYAEWLAGGEPLATSEEVQKIKDTFEAIADGAERTKAKRMWKESFGEPDRLLAMQYAEALRFAQSLLPGEPEKAGMGERMDKAAKR